MVAPNASPIVNLPFLYINNMQLSNDTTTPDEIVNIAAGQCRDSTNVYDIVASASIAIDITNSGLNGLDTGTVAAATLYAVFVVSDPVTGLTTGGLLSTSSTAPVMPFGYSVFRLIGYVRTDGTSDILVGTWSGNNNARRFSYDAPIATAVTAGNATSYTAVSLATFVPAVDNLPVSIAFAFTPGAASRTLSLTPGNGVGDAVTITGQVTAVVVSGNATVISKVTSGVPEIDYKVANSGDAVAINVAAYDFFI